MIKVHCERGTDFSVHDTVTNFTFSFQCSAQISRAGLPALPDSFQPWTPAGEGAWETHHESSGVVQRVTVAIDQRAAALRVTHTLINRGTVEVVANGLRMVTGEIDFGATPKNIGYLHALNVRHGLCLLTALQPEHP